MMRRLPILPTLVVLIAVAVMIGLGFWQIGRAQEKEALIAAADRALAAGTEVPWPIEPGTAENALYRRSRVLCARPIERVAVSGRSGAGEAGWGHAVRCALAGGGEARVVLGWSRSPAQVPWQAGAVSGVIAPGPRLVADPPLAGLEASARPDPSDLPNNHLSYAVQWFLFAGVALVIYGLAVRQKLGTSSSSPGRGGGSPHG